jgi:hypothetical protein
MMDLTDLGIYQPREASSMPEARFAHSPTGRYNKTLHFYWVRFDGEVDSRHHI